MDKNIAETPVVRTLIADGIVLLSQFAITQEQLNDLAPLIYDEVDKEQAKIRTKIQGLSYTAEMVATFEEWNGETRASLIEKLNNLFKQHDELMVWDVTRHYSDTDKHGNSYSAVREIGVKAKNKAVKYTLHSYN